MAHLSDLYLVLHYIPANDVLPHSKSINCKCSVAINLQSKDCKGDDLTQMVCQVVHRRFFTDEAIEKSPYFQQRSMYSH